MKHRLKVTEKNYLRLRNLLLKRESMLNLNKVTFLNKESEKSYQAQLNENYHDILAALQEDDKELVGKKYTDLMNWFRYEVDSRIGLSKLIDTLQKREGQ